MLLMKSMTVAFKMANLVTVFEVLSTSRLDAYFMDHQVFSFIVFLVFI
jgi:hypothetical protein